MCSLSGFPLSLAFENFTSRSRKCYLSPHVCLSKVIIDLYTLSVGYNHRLIVERENLRETAL